MGTKNNPGEFDCYNKADPDEPMFVLLARDSYAPFLVEMWATARQHLPKQHAKVVEARRCAAEMRKWRDANPEAGEPEDGG